MKQRDLKWYFSDWIVVKPSHARNVIDDNEVSDWCTNRFGICGLNWNVGWKRIEPKNRSAWCYMFKNHEDAIMFILTWGGEIIPFNMK